MLRATVLASIPRQTRHHIRSDILWRNLSYSNPLSSTPGSSSSKDSLSSKPPSSSSSTSAPELARQNPVEHPGRTRTPERLLNSPTYVALVKSVAWLMGHNTKASTSIRETRTSYAQCADRDAQEAKFIHEGENSRPFPAFNAPLNKFVPPLFLLKNAVSRLLIKHGSK